MNIKTNSKYVRKSDIFICTHDELEDRHKYIEDIKKASAIVIDKNINSNKDIPFIKVNNTNNTLFDIYNRYYNYPLKSINIIGITGTDGKTSTALIIKQLLNNFTETAYLGTNGFIYKDVKIKTENTTPSIDNILKFTNILKHENIKYLVMETSSEGLLHNRCNNISFKRGIITNVTGDHLNIHKTFNNYLESKLKLFTLLNKEKTSIINTDDISYNIIKERFKDLKIISYGNGDADFKISNIKEESDKTIFDLTFKNKTYKIESPLLGKFNVYNLVCSIATLYSLNIDLDKILNNIKNLKPISGRGNVFYTKKGAKIILDYAHTLNATKEMLKFANKVKKGNIITLLGAAGGRETEKREKIGKLASDFSDLVIFTMDDPRYEKVKNINKELTKNIKRKNYIQIKNRKKAIKYAIKKAKENDLVLILGKGTDNYMAIRDKKKKYNDLDVIKKYI